MGYWYYDICKKYLLLRVRYQNKLNTDLKKTEFNRIFSIYSRYEIYMDGFKSHN